ncbi:GNAT family N-acetyltransferase [Spirosoma sordidisoli]|uniref:GNAT family N-acetyltransferase n=1 Tax=Spirosoma sordidisoli TaxID=2502893 RepID=UPI0013EB5107|nr:GNAT family N-acetyltransferase [Spirosoma sordidisoli]
MNRSTEYIEISAPVRADQAAELSALCLTIYPQHYQHLWYDNGVWYQEHTYNTDQLRKEIAEADVQFYYACVDGKPVGYMKMKLNSDLANEPGGLQVERLYFLNEFTGLGLGTLLMNYAHATALRYGRNYTWLHVMDSNVNAIAFYEKHGYKSVGETHLTYSQMKPHYRRMLQMKRAITDELGTINHQCV